MSSSSMRWYVTGWQCQCLFRRDALCVGFHQCVIVTLGPSGTTFDYCAIYRYTLSSQVAAMRTVS
ncbi:hypothetical protein CY34DRAFT_273120 [Suillus luteus UH-Slu-Lm8-n1]|uniref:Uncharacterized protein n=1 Tax=Suillus luteus UH-Slu-Lm8-n1 TaxID=930992 RepID=A0A0D0AF80_9AGAM|nr:hypothetical protein CY34DRAFT_273120 [Suillus luteus UH-Slu-Lm8-n1]